MDLIDTIFHLHRRGEPGILERFEKWLKDAEDVQGSEFIVDDERYVRKKISSAIFEDIIDEDSTDWILVYSGNKDFQAIGKIRFGEANLIGLKNEYLTVIWIFKSNIESLKVNDKPIKLWSPYRFDSRSRMADYDYTQLIKNLTDPKIKLNESVDWKISKTGWRRIR